MFLTNELETGSSNDPPHLRRPIPSLGCYPYFWLIAYKSEVPIILSLVFIYVLEQLTELRAGVYLLNHLFIVKRYNSEQPDARDAQGREREKGRAASVPSPRAPFSSLSIGSPAQKLFKPHPPGLIWRLRYIGTID